jgi:hypothetical protein
VATSAETRTPPAPLPATVDELLLSLSLKNFGDFRGEETKRPNLFSFDEVKKRYTQLAQHLHRKDVPTSLNLAGHEFTGQASLCDVNGIVVASRIYVVPHIDSNDKFIPTEIIKIKGAEVIEGRTDNISLQVSRFVKLVSGEEIVIYVHERGEWAVASWCGGCWMLPERQKKVKEILGIG